MAWFKSGYKQTDTKDRTASFTQAGTRENIRSGEKHKTLFGKISKYFSDLKPVAFTGSYNDLQDKPSNLAPAAHRHSKSDITDFPSSFPASDVHAWAKAASKPAYTAGEVGALPTSGGAVTGDLHVRGTTESTWFSLGYTQLSRASGGADYLRIDVIKENGYSRNCFNFKLQRDGTNTDSFSPDSNGNADLGISNHRWNQVYAANGTISTSDRNEKENISYIGKDNEYKDTYMSDAQLVKFMRGILPCIFKRINGESGRPHHGIIAQDFEELMAEIGLHDHAAFIKSPKTEEVEVTKKDGSKEIKTQEIPGEYIYGIRYEELISDIIRFSQIMYDRLDSLESTVQKQEEKITMFEEWLSQMEKMI